MIHDPLILTHEPGCVDHFLRFEKGRFAEVTPKCVCFLNGILIYTPEGRENRDNTVMRFLWNLKEKME